MKEPNGLCSSVNPSNIKKTTRWFTASRGYMTKKPSKVTLIDAHERYRDFKTERSLKSNKKLQFLLDNSRESKYKSRI